MIGFASFFGWSGRSRGESIRPSTTLEGLLPELVRETSIAGLRAVMAARYADLSGCRHVVFCDPIEGEHRFAVRTGQEIRRPTFAARGPLARWLRVNETPLLLPDDGEVFAYLPAEERAELELAETRVCLPAMLRGSLVGLILLGRPVDRPLASDSPDDVLDLLQRYTDQAAIVAERVVEAEAERQREQAQSRAQQLAAVGQLAAAMAHEIRNPLNAIRSGVQYVAAQVNAGDDRQELLTEVVAEVDRINRAISNVLGYSRPRELSLETVDVCAVVDRALTLLGPHLRHNRLEVARELPAGPVPAQADAHEVQQVLVNVLLNACEACPDGGRLGIRVVPGTAERPLEIVVADTGRGMTDAELARAFEPFFTTKAQGTGLGLAICRQVMTRHGGDIRIARRDGGGTEVTLTLPGGSA